MFAEDYKSAYHNSAVPGCHSKRRWSTILEMAEDGITLVTKPRLTVGCDDSDCLGGCDRSMAGVRVGGHTFRICCAHFGQRTAGSSLGVMVNCFRRGMVQRSGVCKNDVKLPVYIAMVAVIFDDLVTKIMREEERILRSRIHNLTRIYS
jgi:hypothetical protein